MTLIQAESVQRNCVPFPAHLALSLFPRGSEEVRCLKGQQIEVLTVLTLCSLIIVSGLRVKCPLGCFLLFRILEQELLWFALSFFSVKIWD